MQVYSEIYREEFQCFTFAFDADVVDDPEPYRSLVLERQRCLAKQASIAQAQLTGGRKRRQINEHAKKHEDITNEYFGTPAVYDGARVLLESRTKPTVSKPEFFRRFRMSPFLFESIHDDIKDPEYGCSIFMGRKDAVGRSGASSMQRMVAVFRQLAYGTSADSVWEYTGVRQETARKCLNSFCKFIIRAYGPEFLGRWNKGEMEAEMKVNETRGFPGMLGSIDCCHWEWKNCPIAWQGMYQDRNKKRSIVAEAIAGHDTYIFQAFVGLPGSLNDINIMGRTDTQRKYMHSAAIDVKFKLASQEFTGAYFLADGIYPDYPYLMKTIPEPVNRKQKLFAQTQEGVRKDVERAFGRLHAKWHILKVAGRSHKLKYLKNIWLACIILHNMTLRDQQSAVLERTEERVSVAAAAVDIAVEDESGVLGECETLRDEAFFASHSYEGILGKRKHMENIGICHLMQQALVEHVWLKFGSNAT